MAGGEGIRGAATGPSDGGGPAGASPALPPRLGGLAAVRLPGGLTVVEAGTLRSRATGLARLDALPAAVGLHIPRCRSVHTFGMRFALDLLFLDAGGRPLALVAGVGPRRVVWRRAARSVIEAAAGQGERFAAALSGGGEAAG